MNVFENNFITQFPETTIKFLNEFLSKNSVENLQYNWQDIFYKKPILFEEIARVFIKHHKIEFLENKLNFNYYNHFLPQYNINTINTILIEDSIEHFKKNFPNYIEPIKNLYLNMQKKKSYL